MELAIIDFKEGRKRFKEDAAGVWARYKLVRCRNAARTAQPGAWPVGPYSFGT